MFMLYSFYYKKCLRHKDESHKIFTTFCKQMKNEKRLSITTIRSEYGGEFENSLFENIC